MDLAAQEGVDAVERMFSNFGDDLASPDSPELLSEMFKACKKRRGDGESENP